MKTTTLTEEQKADIVTITFLSIGVILLISFFAFILPNITLDQQVEAYKRNMQQKEIKEAHDFHEKMMLEENKKYISVQP
ncbi:hypothetical protein M2T79_09250 [Elizabethkingia miricola]|uniref:hypothetical protein n=1 Tax=Elizabethkingia miricola TaxID=172045 RepID=UPI0020191330|nr:hypothetical protein [Elizabethkingia miricola]MCL1656784.1 hypothetical protein [Elizabethkingia miricola]